MVEAKGQQEKASRVRITYPLETDSGTEERELPFVVGVLADLSGHAGLTKGELISRKFLEIKCENFDRVLAELAPRLNLEVENRLDQGTTRLRVELHFRRLADFEPAGVLNQVVSLRALLDERRRLQSDRMDLFEKRTLELDRLISEQLDEILHTPDFQRLEATWRGVYLLVSELPATPRVKVRILDISKKDLLRDQQKSASFDQSILFKKVHDDEYGMFGGEPYGILVGDHDFGPKPEDLQLLKAMAKVASAADAPFIAAANPGMFGTRSFAELSDLRSLHKIFESPAYAAWRSFRDEESARCVGLTLPRVLMRAPFIDLAASSADYHHGEIADAFTYLWGNAAYLFAARLIRSFAEYGWFDGIGGRERENFVAGLPHAPVAAPDGVKERPIDAWFDAKQARELSELGFIPLLHSEQERAVVISAASSCGKPAKYIDAQTTASALLMVQLRYVFAASLLARYIKVIARDAGLDHSSAAERQKLLNGWIQRFVAPKDSGIQAAYPLCDAQVEVKEHQRHRGVYFAIVSFRPRFKGEEIKTPLRIAVLLP